MNYIKLIRPLNLLIIIITMLLFRYCIVAASPYRIFYIKQILTDAQFFILVLSTAFIAAGGYVINDIFDIDIDNVNRPDKVIIGNSISEDTAYNFYKVLCIAGIVCTLVLAFLTKNYRLSLFPIIVMVILNFYAHTFKKQLIVGNFMIAICTSFTIVLIALFESGGTEEASANESYVRSGIAIAALIYGAFAFLTTFLREVIKDEEDKTGDEQFDCKTIPIVFGTKGTKITSLIIIAFLLLILSSIAWFFISLKIQYIGYVVGFGLVLPLVVLGFLILRAKSTSHFHFISNLLKGYMCLGIASMLYFRSGIGPYIFVQYANFMNKLF